MRRPARLARVNLRTWAWQALTLLIGILLIGWLAHNLVSNLARRGITVGFDFLDRAARFPISESLLPYSPTDSFGWAFVVGFSNTLALSLLVIVSATTLGFFLALARRSRHPLAHGTASVLVEAARNTPLVVQLLFWYSAVTFGLPSLKQALQPIRGVFLTDRGLYLPSMALDMGAVPLAITFVAAIAAIIAGTLVGRRQRIATGKPNYIGTITAACAAIVVVIAGLASVSNLHLEYPVAGKFNFSGGITLSPEFVAIVLGLVVYSSAFAGEIIRGGIDAIPTGQWEAGRAAGLSERHTLRLVIVPQALRIIVPPMTSQYINIVKNSTLALVVGFPELNFVTATTINQTGQAVEGIVILMLAFLLVSASASLLMNWYHRRIALPER